MNIHDKKLITSMKLTKTLLCILFFLLPFIHGKILYSFWIELWFSLRGNYEFSKVIFFNVFCSFVFVSYFLESIFTPLSSKNKWKKEWIWLFRSWAEQRGWGWGIILFIILSLLLSTFFSLSPFISLIWDTEKWHTALMFLNLIWLYIVLQNIDKDTLKRLMYVSISAGILTGLFAIKELYFPSFHYWELWSRALGSFGHPNYLAGYLLLILPLLSHIKNTSLKHLFIWVIFITIVLSKSYWWIFLAFLYVLYTFSKKLSSPLRRGLGWAIILVWLISILLLIEYSPEKLHSFLSRFAIWESVLRIIFSSSKIFFFWGGLETLPYLFESFKTPEVYIYENFWYTADRPHNFFLNIWYHFWFLGVNIFVYSLYSFIKKINNTYVSHSIVLFLLFGIFHFFSVTSYALVVLLISVFLKSESSRVQQWWMTQWVQVFIIFACLIWAYYSLQLYQSEIFFKQKKYTLAEETFSHPKYLIELWNYSQAHSYEWLISSYNYKNQIITEAHKWELCEKLTQTYPSSENYFYCGNILEKIDTPQRSLQYYHKGLALLPDLWNTDSPYWEKYFIKHTITGNRFFSEKFWDVAQIVQKVHWKDINFK